MDEYFEEKLKQHFTAPELIDFLGLTMEDIIDRLSDRIMDKYADLVDEICFDFEEGEDNE